MSFDAQAIEPKIRSILTAPGTDLSTISAKRVRKVLLELDSSLTPELVRAQKDEIDKVISKVYEEVSAEQADASGDDGSDGHKRKHTDDASSEAEAAAPPKKARKTKKKPQEVADEELARQLSNEINGRARTSRAAASGKTKAKANGAKRAKKGPKSSATVASDGEAGSDGDEDKPKRRGGGFKKEYVLSEPLAALLKVEKLSRPQTVKQLWVHIKANNLQNPENRKEIICDDLFKRIFKVDRLDMFDMNKQLTQHLHEAPAPS
ncbi:SWIB/MDM2 domain-containing protein [Lenzites betulinus]|nr:SWIB/MDM2 domain-containing protein [Lenzites betulinus]